jgi:drug/metabolite transporter (DMT)-like permease
MNHDRAVSVSYVDRILQWTGTQNLWSFLPLSISIFSISSAAIFIRLCERELSPNSTAFNRLWIASLAFILIAGIESLRNSNDESQEDAASHYSVKNILLILAMVVAVSGSLYCWVWSISRTSVANATLFRNFSPIFTGLGGWLFLGQRFSRQFTIGIVITLLGASLIEIPHIQFSPDGLGGDLLALSAAFFYGAYMLLVKALRKQFSTNFILIWRCLLGTLVAWLVVFATHDIFLPNSLQSWLSVIGFALVCQVIGQGLLAYCLKQFSAVFVSVTHLLEPLLAALMGFLIFSETLGITVGLSFMVVLVGLYLVISSTDQKSSTDGSVSTFFGGFIPQADASSSLQPHSSSKRGQK